MTFAELDLILRSAGYFFTLENATAKDASSRVTKITVHLEGGDPIELDTVLTHRRRKQKNAL